MHKHPGKFLQAEMIRLELSASDVARQLRVPINRVTEIIHGRRGVTADTALRLARFFGDDAFIWMERQARFDLQEAETKSGAKIRAIAMLKSPHYGRHAKEQAR